MRASSKWVCLPAVVLGVLLSASAVLAEDISGPISTTRMIRDNSRLVGDVTCTVTGAPCIQFAAGHIELRLNGFTITGPGDANTACGGTTSTGTETGIHSGAQTDVEIRGPGIVQRFRGDGILFNGTLLGKVEGVTITTNCMSGIRVTATSSRITLGSNVAVRNGSAVAACGGIWIIGSNNSLRWNETTGNGFATPNDDFGIGILNGDGNLVEENTAYGNTNGIVIAAAATNTRIRGNIAVGNPSIQQSIGVAGSVGVDIWDQSPRGATFFDNNLCITAVNAPCPGLAPSQVPRKPGR
jgi:parallel beta-helix repeat protein